MLWLAAALAAEPVPEPVAKPVGVTHWVVVPAMAFDQDDGFGAGARLEVSRMEPGFDPYRAAFVVHAFASTNGFHHHRLRFDLPQLGKHQNMRLMGHFAYRQWLNDGYWGMGNATTVDRAYDIDDVNDPRHKRYRYTLIQPFGRLSLRAEMGGPWSVYGSLAARWTRVDTYAGSLLEEEQPLGMKGGFSTQLGGGVLYDTRQPELTPDTGLLLELGARVSPPLPTTEGEWASALASVRAYQILGPKVVVATRLMGEHMFGEIPFYDLITWGTYVPVLGFGGSDTIRGANFGRWRAPGKALFNTELRFDAWHQRVLKRDLRWQAVPFLDAGMVFGTEEEAVADNTLPVHPSVGFGLHPTFDNTVTGRFDAAMGIDMVKEADGRITYEPNFGGYIVFDQLF